MKNIAQAIVEVTKAVKGVEKNSNVGTGQSSYKGVNDKDVKETMRKAMAENGLSLVPIEVSPKTEVTRWEEKTQWGVKQKQSVFTEVITRYLLLHTSGESIELAGYGHGVDAQDKGAGKATTYALKYALLYTFLVPTGDIDDADSTHSNDIQTPQNAPQSLSDALEKVSQSTTLAELDKNYLSLSATMKKDDEVIAKCSEIKKQLSK
jgi:hypothetical protein